MLITGATGTVGGELLRQARGATGGVRAYVRNAERADDLRGYDCEVVLGHLEDDHALRRAAEGVDTVFLLTPAAEGQAALEAGVIAAIADAAPGAHVVKLAALGWDAASPVRLLRSHAAGVEALQSSGLPWTVLAPTGFQQNIFGSVAAITQRGELPVPGGSAGPGVAHVDVRDIAAAALLVLQEPSEHAGAAYELTGPAILTWAEVAEIVGSAAGREVRAVDVSAEDFRARMVSTGGSAWLAEGLLELYAGYRGGTAARLSPDLDTVLGRPPTSLAHTLAAYPALLRV